MSTATLPSIRERRRVVSPAVTPQALAWHNGVLWMGSRDLRRIYGIEPDTWTTFNTKSMLGGALLGQKKYAEAEPLLLKGYAGMKRRERRSGRRATPASPKPSTA